ncbi:PREDICTED: RNA polymerase II C-terminal domain phosphatase-like 1 [Tarenaya hassleriana]|uniref:RNA polymerase II C-terminal domain phosphatase-like 1 n=1 Tax=Tarenaya hassleriana TaxID=28532 RepID=UPI00053C938B|nr:PREDICTED: RNA polymerase II C-terminal domain phosphatase-like 1 [Tarenaya hassleriana]
MYSNRVEVYNGEGKVGEMEVHPPRESEKGDEMMMLRKKKRREIMEEVKKGIRISHFSQPSERCPPLAVLHTISSSGLCFKLEATAKFKSSSSSPAHEPLRLFHSSCLRDNKTAVMLLGEEEELHLVAMYSRNNEKEYPCFWAFNVASGLYNSCLVMLNLRCLGIVFDLDETLIVANTMRSFEDRIEGLQRRINNEVEPQRIAVMVAEMKRYQDDKNILRQYVESDQVVDNGKVIKVQTEVVPALSDNHQPVVRPLIRLQEKNIILTRINPMIRDTSVLVRLRPAWEELRSYLTARGRKRFEVYVCTMAERDYALEMWRLLDPEGNLINTNELLDRIVCVKSGSRKSLFNVFQDGTCHPKMALVIDDRLKVWDDKDQPRVHVVPAFAPYYAPQAEAAAIPVLCVARNVACNVRGGFFKDFDDCLLQRIGEISYENDIEDIHSPPDVSHYLVSEDEISGSNGNKDLLSFDGMADAEVERRLKEAISASSAVPAGVNLDPRLAASLAFAMPSTSVSVPVPAVQPSAATFPPMQFQPSTSIVKPLVSAGSVEPSLQNSPAREEGEVPESELDPDTRRRLLILQHGQDSRDPAPSEPPLPQRPPVQVPPPHVQPRSGWFPVEEEIDPAPLRRTVPKEYPLDSEMVHVEKHRSHQSSFFPMTDGSTQPDRMLRENRRPPRESFHRDELLRSNNNKSGSHAFYGEEASLSRSSSRSRDLDSVSGRIASAAETPADVLHDIAMKCGTKVEFKPGLVASSVLQFSVEAWFSGERIGEGFGRTRREALHKAAEASIQNLADVYLSRTNPDPRPSNRDASAFANGSTFLGNGNMVENRPFGRDESAPFSAMSDPSRPTDPRLEGSIRPMGSISALRELCAMEGFDVAFQAQRPPSDMVQKDELYVQVEIDGRVLGEGVGLTWDEARMQAAERALSSLRSMIGQSLYKRPVSPRSSHGMSSKRMKPEFQRSLQRMPSSGRYP